MRSTYSQTAFHPTIVWLESRDLHVPHLSEKKGKRWIYLHSLTFTLCLFSGLGIPFRSTFPSFYQKWEGSMERWRKAWSRYGAKRKLNLAFNVSEQMENNWRGVRRMRRTSFVFVLSAQMSVGKWKCFFFFPPSIFRIRPVLLGSTKVSFVK